jgi:hypothetical protein
MTKLFYTFILLIFMINADAQRGFHIGVSGAFNSIWILNQNNYGTLAPFQIGVVRTSEMDYKPTWGGAFGIDLGYNFGRVVGIQSGVQYSFNGQHYEDKFLGPAIIGTDTFGTVGDRYVPVERDIRLSYIQVPVLVKFMTKPGRVAKFVASFGPQIGVRTTAKEEIRVAGNIYVPGNYAFTSREKFKTLDVGFALNLGTEIYATDNLYFHVALANYVAVTDLNGKVLKSLGWYSQNDVEYQKSFNLQTGLSVGIHYIIGEGRIDY